MRAKEFLKEFEFPDVGGKIYDLTHPKQAPAQTPVAPKLGPSTIPTQPAKQPAPAIAAPVKPEPQSFPPASYRDLVIKIARSRGFTKDSDLSKLLGQISHETLGWTKGVENMNYSTPDRIYKFFTHAFKTVADAIPYVNNPVALANKVYAGVNGNGDEASGDGWTYRGRGFMHITGRANYYLAGKSAHPNDPNIYINNPFLLSSNPTESALGAVEYFKAKVGFGKTTKQASTVINKNAGHKERNQATKIEADKLKQRRKKPTR